MTRHFRRLPKVKEEINGKELSLITKYHTLFSYAVVRLKILRNGIHFNS